MPDAALNLSEKSRTLVATPDCVRSLDYTAKVADMSKDTLRRLIAVGKGPRVTRLSIRKVGVRDSDRERWLAERSA